MSDDKSTVKQRPGEREPTTYHAMAHVEDELGGRWVEPPSKQPAGPQWTQDLAALPPEPPLGLCVDELPDMRTVNGENVAGDEPWQYRNEQAQDTAAVEVLAMSSTRHLRRL